MKKYAYVLIITAVVFMGALWWLSARLHFSGVNSEVGPHQGRLFHKDNFYLELCLIENNSTPKLYIYTYLKKKIVPPSQINLSIQLKRLDGEINQLTFRPQDNYLVSQETVKEPHSFDVKIKAIYQKKSYEGTLPYYENRTQLSVPEAKEANIQIATAGSGVIKKYVHLNGRITLNRNTTVNIMARFPGMVKNVFVKWGDTVKKGDLLATIESNESLKEYEVRAPVDGRVLERNISTGSVAGNSNLFTIANLSDVWAELHVFPRDLGKVNAGQMVTLHSEEGDQEVEAPITMLLPTADPLSQTVVVIVTIANPKEAWRPGTIVRGDVLIAEKAVPILIKTTALQNYKGSTVVFITNENQYEMRTVILGEKDDQWVEIKSGLKPGTKYVAGNSFLIKADIEKSGVEHDH